MIVKNRNVKTVVLDSPIKIRFSNGKELKIVIFDKIPDPKTSDEFRVSNDTPLAKALLGKTQHSLVEYSVEGEKNEVKILKIY